MVSDDFTKKDIFNADETGIFYKMLPDKTHKLKRKTWSGGNLSKERFASASGTEKRKLLIIGKLESSKL